LILFLKLQMALQAQFKEISDMRQGALLPEPDILPSKLEVLTLIMQLYPWETIMLLLPDLYT